MASHFSTGMDWSFNITQYFLFKANNQIFIAKAMRNIVAMSCFEVYAVWLRLPVGWKVLAGTERTTRETNGELNEEHWMVKSSAGQESKTYGKLVSSCYFHVNTSSYRIITVFVLVNRRGGDMREYQSRQCLVMASVERQSPLRLLLAWKDSWI